MKKYVLFVTCLLINAILLSACHYQVTPQKKQQTINYTRKLEKYLPAEQSSSANGTIDLSEGPKLKYDAKFGPKDMNFDIKVVNPYKF